MKNLFSLQKIETPRLKLRPLLLNDDMALFDTIKKSQEILKPWYPWAQTLELEKIKEFVHKAVSDRHAQQFSYFPLLMLSKENDEIIGQVSFNHRSNPAKKIYEIGSWRSINCHGKGYSQEAINALSRYAFEQLDASVTVLRTRENNVAANSLAKRLNFLLRCTIASDTKENATDHYYTCENIDMLPPLEISWECGQVTQGMKKFSL
tara:strand:+ start:1865 stop:2485 length:621 start_codon:yes stop_codon:yes gene_type:complete